MSRRSRRHRDYDNEFEGRRPFRDRADPSWFRRGEADWYASNDLYSLPPAVPFYGPDPVFIQDDGPPIFPDRRPDAFTPLDRSTFAPAARRPVGGYPPSQIRAAQLQRPVFRSEEGISICLRRRLRREVMHALGIAGRRGVGAGGSRRNEDSHYRC